MVAVIGLGRASDGSLLSSEDLEILQTISGYVAVAVENSLLYQEQEKRAEELALLKEFNESIVESVNVGLLAVDENGRITRCNSPFEEMLDLSREQTIGKRVEEIFDESFALNLENILGKSRWHLTEIRNAYKLFTTNAQGKSLIINVAVAPLRSVSRNQTGAIIVLENVTSRIKLEETFQQSEKLSSIGLARRRRRARSQHASDGSFELYADAARNDSRNRPETRASAKSSKTNRPRFKYRRKFIEFFAHRKCDRIQRNRHQQTSRRYASTA